MLSRDRTLPWSISSSIASLLLNCGESAQFDSGNCDRGSFLDQFPFRSVGQFWVIFSNGQFPTCSIFAHREKSGSFLGLGHFWVSHPKTRLGAWGGCVLGYIISPIKREHTPFAFHRFFLPCCGFSPLLIVKLDEIPPKFMKHLPC